MELEIETNSAALDGMSVAQRLAAIFRAGDQELYLVGGAVRDSLLGHKDFDLDFATSARPEETTALLEAAGIDSLYRIGEKYGTIGITLREQAIEITTYRSQEVYAPGSRKPEVWFGTSLLEDLGRRDFTINAMARDPLTGELVDPLGGQDDLSAGLIRSVGDSRARFREDPLRLLRAIRFARRLNFQIESATWTAMGDAAPSLQHISRERIRGEYSSMLAGPDAVGALTLLRDGRLLDYSVPELLELTRMQDHGPFHPLSLWDHVMFVVKGVEARLAVRWAAVLHDIAKPATRTYEPNGRPRFFHHEELGGQMTRQILASLRYPRTFIDDVVLLVETHMQLHSYSSEWSDGAVRRLMLRLGALTQDAITLSKADAAGHSLSAEAENAQKLDELRARIQSLNQVHSVRLSSPLSGDQLMQHFRLPPGPWIKRIKTALCDAVIEGELDCDDIEGAWRMAGDLMDSHEPAAR